MICTLHQDQTVITFGGLEQIFLSEALLELIDKIYSHGHVDGWGRAAYEIETEEDVGPSYEDIIRKEKD